MVCIATNCNPVESTTVQRRSKDGSSTSVPCPESITLYNKFMGGVDYNDQLRGYYNVRLKGRKFYKYIFWFLFDVAITNSYVLCKNHTDISIPNVKKFRNDLAKELIVNFNNRKRRGRPSITPSNKTFCADHFPTRSGQRLRCHYCYHQKDKQRHETVWQCISCQVPLCHTGQSDDCFLMYHKSI